VTVNVLTEAIEQGVPLTVLAPHLDDAVLSCGALMIHAAKHTSVTVATFFTEAGQPPYTLSARQYLRQVGERDAQALYRQRRAEDRAVLEPAGIVCLHFGLTDALFRRRPQAGRRSLWARLLPELVHIYPTYRVHITSGRIAAADAGTLREVSHIIQRLASSGPNLMLAPRGVGGHVDHVLVRRAAERSGAQVVYYSDFPYNQRHPVYSAFTPDRGLEEIQWREQIEEKVELIRSYRTQAEALFQGNIPLVPEVFFVAPDDAGRFSADEIGSPAKARDKRA
jgi:LmbE family N-acetylglucosaminyl deacetylase